MTRVSSAFQDKCSGQWMHWCYVFFQCWCTFALADRCFDNLDIITVCKCMFPPWMHW